MPLMDWLIKNNSMHIIFQGNFSIRSDVKVSLFINCVLFLLRECYCFFQICMNRNKNNTRFINRDTFTWEPRMVKVFQFKYCVLFLLRFMNIWETITVFSNFHEALNWNIFTVRVSHVKVSLFINHVSLMLGFMTIWKK